MKEVYTKVEWKKYYNFFEGILQLVYKHAEVYSKKKQCGVILIFLYMELNFV